MESEGSVRLARMFCPANDRNVPILFRDRKPEPDAFSRAGPGEPISCLDYAFRCTGWLCPHFASPELPAEGLIELALRSEKGSVQTGTVERQAILERAVHENRQLNSRPRSRRSIRDEDPGLPRGRWGQRSENDADGVSPT